jgi:hypothetical protein
MYLCFDAHPRVGFASAVPPRSRARARQADVSLKDWLATTSVTIDSFDSV